MTTTRDWRDHADCATTDPELFYSDKPADIDLAKAICRGCPALTNCLTDAITDYTNRGDNYSHGVAGGLTKRERRAAHHENLATPHTIQAATTLLTPHWLRRALALQALGHTPASIAHHLRRRGLNTTPQAVRLALLWHGQRAHALHAPAIGDTARVARAIATQHPKLVQDMRGRGSTWDDIAYTLGATPHQVQQAAELIDHWQQQETAA